MDPKSIVKGGDVQTPAPKQRQAECPPAPVKRYSESDTEKPARQTLTKAQINQLRKSWGEAVRGTQDDQ